MGNTFVLNFGLLGVVFTVALLIVLLLNWKEIINILIQDYHSRSTEKISAWLKLIKIMLLKIVGATKSDLEYKKGLYLKSDAFCKNYFVENKFKCIWQLFTYYMFYSFILTYTTKPINFELSLLEGKLVSYGLNKDPFGQIINLTLLSSVNVITDLTSLTITFILLTKICKSIAQTKLLKATRFIFLDILIAFLLFSFSQLVSNWLYPRSILNPPADYDFLSLDAMLMPYAVIKDVSASGSISFYDFTFPGQLLLTGTVFIPTIIGMAFVLILTLSFGLLEILKLVTQNRQKIIREDAYIEATEPSKVDGYERKNGFFIYYAANFIFAIITSIIGGILTAYILETFNPFSK